jgi:hypothetical protein
MVPFTDVADYGSFEQWAVVVFGVERFVSVSGNADVLPGKSVDTDGYISMWFSDDDWYANISKYSFATGTATPLTDYTSGYPRRLSISPDGAQVVYEYQVNGEWTDLMYDLDLWMTDRDGNGRTMFVQNARAPAWSLVALPEPLVPEHDVFLPSVYRP